MENSPEITSTSIVHGKINYSINLKDLKSKKNITNKDINHTKNHHHHKNNLNVFKDNNIALIKIKPKKNPLALYNSRNKQKNIFTNQSETLENGTNILSNSSNGFSNTLTKNRNTYINNDSISNSNISNNNFSTISNNNNNNNNKLSLTTVKFHTNNRNINHYLLTETMQNDILSCPSTTRNNQKIFCSDNSNNENMSNNINKISKNNDFRRIREVFNLNLYDKSNDSDNSKKLNKNICKTFFEKRSFSNQSTGITIRNKNPILDFKELSNNINPNTKNNFIHSKTYRIPLNQNMYQYNNTHIGIPKLNLTNNIDNRKFSNNSETQFIHISPLSYSNKDDKNKTFTHFRKPKCISNNIFNLNNINNDETVFVPKFQKGSVLRHNIISYDKNFINFNSNNEYKKLNENSLPSNKDLNNEYFDDRDNFQRFRTLTDDNIPKYIKRILKNDKNYLSKKEKDEKELFINQKEKNVHKNEKNYNNNTSDIFINDSQRQKVKFNNVKNETKLSELSKKIKKQCQKTHYKKQLSKISEASYKSKYGKNNEDDDSFLRSNNDQSKNNDEIIYNEAKENEEENSEGDNIINIIDEFQRDLTSESEKNELVQIQDAFESKTDQINTNNNNKNIHDNYNNKNDINNNNSDQEKDDNVDNNELNNINNLNYLTKVRQKEKRNIKLSDSESENNYNNRSPTKKKTKTSSQNDYKQKSKSLQRGKTNEVNSLFLKPKQKNNNSSIISEFMNLNKASIKNKFKKIKTNACVQYVPNKENDISINKCKTAREKVKKLLKKNKKSKYADEEGDEDEEDDCIDMYHKKLSHNHVNSINKNDSNHISTKSPNKSKSNQSVNKSNNSIKKITENTNNLENNKNIIENNKNNNEIIKDKNSNKTKKDLGLLRLCTNKEVINSNLIHRNSIATNKFKEKFLAQFKPDKNKCLYENNFTEIINSKFNQEIHKSVNHLYNTIEKLLTVIKEKKDEEQEENDVNNKSNNILIKTNKKHINKIFNEIKEYLFKEDKDFSKRQIMMVKIYNFYLINKYFGICIMRQKEIISCTKEYFMQKYFDNYKSYCSHIISLNYLGTPICEEETMIKNYTIQSKGNVKTYRSKKLSPTFKDNDIFNHLKKHIFNKSPANMNFILSFFKRDYYLSIYSENLLEKKFSNLNVFSFKAHLKSGSFYKTQNIIINNNSNNTIPKKLLNKQTVKNKINNLNRKINPFKDRFFKRIKTDINSNNINNINNNEYRINKIDENLSNLNNINPCKKNKRKNVRTTGNIYSTPIYYKESVLFTTYEIKAKMINNLKTIKDKLIFHIKDGNFKEFYEIMEKYKIDKNITDHEGNTLLILAIFSNNKSIIEYLLNKGFDINMPNKYSFNTPLHYAVLYRNYELIDLLISRGADENILNYDGYTPWEFLNVYKLK